MYLQMNKTIKPSFAKRIGFTFLMMLLTAATAWAQTQTTISTADEWNTFAEAANAHPLAADSPLCNR